MLCGAATSAGVTALDRRLPNPDSVLTMAITIPDAFIVSSSSTLGLREAAERRTHARGGAEDGLH